MPICLPGFTPTNVHREDPGVAPPVHDAHTDIYHMAWYMVYNLGFSVQRSAFWFRM